MVAFNKLSQYGLGFQIKVLNSLLKNKKFTLNIRDVIMPSYFENEAHKWIVREALQYFDKSNNNKIVTVFSAPNYCGNCGNDGAVMKISENLVCSFIIIKPTNIIV